ncbi:hypothetical protein ACFQ1I_25440 [Kitasatospora arboriphila]
MESPARPRPASLTAWWLLTASSVLWFTAALGTAAYAALVLQPFAAPRDASGYPDGEEQFVRMIETGPALFCGLTFLLRTASRCSPRAGTPGATAARRRSRPGTGARTPWPRGCCPRGGRGRPAPPGC